MSRVKTFFQSTTILKLKKIGKILNLNIYPKKFYNKGFRSIYSKLIFNLIFFEKQRALKKHFYKKIFYNKNLNDNKKINFLFSSPSSGGTFLRMMITSYLELFYKIGDGVPKYDSIHNKWIYNFPFFEGASLKNAIDFSMMTLDSKSFRRTDDLENKKVTFSRYPLAAIELHDFNQIKPIIIMRNPHDQIISYYSKNFNDQENESLDTELLIKAVDNYLEYFTFWKRYFENRKDEKDYLLIKYESLVTKSEDVLKKALSFYGFEVENELIPRAALINSKESTLKALSSIKINKIRFTDENKKKKNREIILQELNKIDKFKNIIEDYSNIR